MKDMVMSFSSGSIISALKKKKNLLALSCMILLILIVVFLLLNYTSKDAVLSGTIYIDSLPASMNVEVKIVFPDGEVSDPDGTDEQGRYRIDVSGFIDDVGTFFIYYNGTTYAARNLTGDFFDVRIVDSIDDISVDLFVYTSDDDSSNEDDSSEDDTSDDINDDDPSDTEDDDSSDETDDTNDDGSDDDDDSSDDNDNGSDDDQDDDTDEEEPNSFITVEKMVWNNASKSWVQEVFVNRSDIVNFQISIEYNGSNYLNNISINDILPSGLNYTGNATVNGSIFEPLADLVNHTISWEFTNLTIHNKIMILYNCSVNKTGSQINTVNVKAIENTSKILSDVDNASVKVFGDIRLTKLIWNDMTQNWVDIYANDIGKIVRFRISIAYQGNFTVQSLVAIDSLPIGLEYCGNATVDGVLKEPMIDLLNHTLYWNLSDLQSNQVVHIEFNVNITENTTFTNNVRATGVESIGKHFNITTSARVTGIGPKQIFCIKQVKSGNDSWSHEVNAFVGTVTSFKITLINNGNNSYYNLNIIDSLPPSLSYVENSSIILFNNQTFFSEPTRDPAKNMLLWININSVIQDYLDSGENISVTFNASVEAVGLLINTVNVTSTICNECDPLEISDTAIVNATMPILGLHVNVGGPYVQRPMIPVVLTANATGGEPPYAYLWDLNNDSIFDDGNTSTVTITWDAIGLYAVTVKVIDNKNDSAFNRTYVNISIPPLMVDAFGPYTAFVGDVVSFHAEASGGVLNYSWYWDFDDGNSSIMQNPSHIYVTAGIYSAIVIVTDQENHSKNDTASVTIKKRDIVPPQIDMEHPKDAIYIKNRPVFPFFTPLVFGEITINVSATDKDTSVEKIEIRINDELIGIWYNSSVRYVWSDSTIGRYKLYVVAYDVAGNWNVMEKMVWKIF